MVLHSRHCTLLLLLGLAMTASSIKCDRRIDGISKPSLDLQNKFEIVIYTINRYDVVYHYMPRVKYIVSIERTRLSHKALKFTRFLLTAKNINASKEAGKFELADKTLTKFSKKCLGAVTEGAQIARANDTVFWTSPPEDSGCIIISAAVLDIEKKWYIDEGDLVRTICQDPKFMLDDPGVVLDKCCACDEARYDIKFQGLWSKNTHHKEFPEENHLVHFSDVIGVSHAVNYRFWEMNKLASKGLQEIAESGSTKILESEFKRQGLIFRTIIKAQGVPNTHVTVSMFRVNRTHHLLSLVSKIVPSPDWIVGVSGLELCLPNCSWIEYKELNLYPIDVGTDDGITYTSPDSPIDPHQPIRVITTSYPNDKRSPFHNPKRDYMNPVAKLHLKREQLYKGICDVSIINKFGKNVIKHKSSKEVACQYTDWSEWSECKNCSNHVSRNRSIPVPAKNDTEICENKLIHVKHCSKPQRCWTKDNHFFNGIARKNQVTKPKSSKKIGCQYSDISEWSRCENCTDHAYKQQIILVRDQNGTLKCWEMHIRKKLCSKFRNCSSENTRRHNRHHGWHSNCKFAWCNATCDESYQYQTRISKIYVNDSKHKRCKKLVKFRKCPAFRCV